jgi:hypothetical protein
MAWATKPEAIETMSANRRARTFINGLLVATGREGTVAVLPIERRDDPYYGTILRRVRTMCNIDLRSRCRRPLARRPAGA